MEQVDSFTSNRGQIWTWRVEQDLENGAKSGGWSGPWIMEQDLEDGAGPKEWSRT